MWRIHWIGLDDTETVEEAKEKPSLKQMQEFVGGYVEMIPVTYNGRKASMYVNEEGNIIGLAVNERATKVLRDMSAQMARPLNPNFPGIRGPAVLLQGIRSVQQPKEKSHA